MFAVLTALHRSCPLSWSQCCWKSWSKQRVWKQLQRLDCWSSIAIEWLGTCLRRAWLRITQRSVTGVRTSGCSQRLTFFHFLQKGWNHFLNDGRDTLAHQFFHFVVTITRDFDLRIQVRTIRTNNKLVIQLTSNSSSAFVASISFSVTVPLPSASPRVPADPVSVEKSKSQNLYLSTSAWPQGRK